MLYGSEETKKIIMKKTREIADKRGGKLLFGANVGSISQGLERYDSDYDTRFLYYNPATPNDSYALAAIPERDLIYRYEPEDHSLFYDRIAFWDMTAFLHFLCWPQIEGTVSYGLYNVVQWTFLSPYTWDPYGIGGKLVPLMRAIFHPDWAISFYRAFIDDHFAPGSQEIERREYLLVIRAAMSIQWIRRFQTFAPVHLSPLLAVSEDQRIRDYVEAQINWLREQSIAGAEGGKTIRRQASHYLTGQTDPEIDNWIAAILARPDPLRVSPERPDRDAEKLVQKMLEITLNSTRPNIVGGV